MKSKAIISLACSILATTIGLSTTVYATNISLADELITIAEYKEINGKNTLIKYENNTSDKKPVLFKNTKNKLPAKYNLADENEVSSVQEQSPYGTCWAFSSLASMESNFLKKNKTATDIDLSEKHLVYFTYNNGDNSTDKSLYGGTDSYSSRGYSPFKIGCSSYHAATTLMRRYGGVNEISVPYEFTTSGETVDDKFRTQGDVYLKSYTELPSTTVKVKDRSTGEITSQELLPEADFYNTLNTLKTYVYNTGAIACSYFCSDAMSGHGSDDNYWNKSTYSYYFDASYKTDSSDNGFRNVDHGVTIVGWDDDYAKENFAITPPADGAWIVKNSWGDDWGNNGYFYLSYYDLSINDFAAFEAERIDYDRNGATIHEYDNIYQYDGTGYGNGVMSLPKHQCAGANFFTARGNETLRAISTYSMIGNVTVSYSVYINPTSSTNPTTGILAESGSIDYKYAGYYTIDLNTPIKLKKDDKYAVTIEIKYTNNDTPTYIIPFEYNSGNTYNIEKTKGVSSIYILGNWTAIENDTVINSSQLLGNTLIKAYTTNEITDFNIGDINLDHRTDIRDVTLTQMYIAGNDRINRIQLELADYNEDNSIDINDVTAQQKFLANITD